jgi:hypothetical protein
MNRAKSLLQGNPTSRSTKISITGLDLTIKTHKKKKM